MAESEIEELEDEIGTLVAKLNALRKANPPTEVPNYRFDTIEGETTLGAMFGDRDRLLVIHNMGQGCRYCTLWADGINPFVPHLESSMAVVLLSKDDPATQRRLANARGWRFRTASHGGGAYIQEQTVSDSQSNCPGAVCYVRKEGKIFRRNSCAFGPGDLYCSHWHLLGLAGLDTGDWTPQFNYWRRPEQMDDGGENLVD